MEPELTVNPGWHSQPTCPGALYWPWVLGFHETVWFTSIGDVMANQFYFFITLLIHLITSIQVFSVTFRTLHFFSFLFFYMWSNPLCLILNIHYTWKLITHFSKKWFALICLGNMKDVWQFFWDIFGFIWDLSDVFGVHICSARAQIQYLKSSLIVHFGGMIF